LYDRELKRLQAEIVTMPRSVVESGMRVLVIFEGRDAAGKGAIKRIIQHHLHDS
jgi:polyphosphate kinase 2 (PPK2 family)